MSNFWSIYIIVIVVVSILIYSGLIYFTRNIEQSNESSEHHVYDGIEENNKPLPFWWVSLFVLSIIFAIIYLFFYPGLGKFNGILNWTSKKECDNKTLEENKLYEPIYIALGNKTIDELKNDLKALKIARSIFVNNCAICHGVDAKGALGFPNLTNNKWLYGGDVNDIKHTITNGRNGKMPPLGVVVGDDLDAVAVYVLSLSQKVEDKELIERGKSRFNKICNACHGQNAKGNKFLGAPDLTDPQWIYGGSIEDIKKTITTGRSGFMPAHKNILTKEQIHILTAYIHLLNNS